MDIGTRVSKQLLIIPFNSVDLLKDLIENIFENLIGNETF